MFARRKALSLVLLAGAAMSSRCEILDESQ
jgi:hypothetical protein